jgi:hypothetical protein
LGANLPEHLKIILVIGFLVSAFSLGVWTYLDSSSADSNKRRSNLGADWQVEVLRITLETIQGGRRSVKWTFRHYRNGDHPKTETIPNKRDDLTGEFHWFLRTT